MLGIPALGGSGLSLELQLEFKPSLAIQQVQDQIDRQTEVKKIKTPGFQDYLILLQLPTQLAHRGGKGRDTICPELPAMCWAFNPLNPLEEGLLFLRVLQDLSRLWEAP